MIDFLKGIVDYIEQDFVVIDVQGVGYRVYCPDPHVFEIEKESKIFIHHHVREDAILLYGFSTRDEQRLFRKLLDVNGIGPRVALGMLSAIRPEALVTAIEQENISMLTKLPGIGRKTAQRIIIDLKDKLQEIGGLAEKSDDLFHTSSVTTLTGDENWQLAKEGLLALGITDKEAEEAWMNIQAETNEHSSVDQIMKSALKVLYKG